MERDWSTFTRRISVRPPSDVGAHGIYVHWTVPLAIEQWFLYSAEYTSPLGLERSDEASAQKGDSYFWRWCGYGDEVFERGTILEANGVDGFAFSFTGGSIVSVAIKNEGGATIVQLTQSGIPDDPERDIYINCSYAWTFYLANLKSILEGGIDLRNKDVNIHNVVNS